MVEIRIIKDDRLLKLYYTQNCLVDYEKKEIEFFDFEYRQYCYESIDSGFHGSGMPYFYITIKD